MFNPNKIIQRSPAIKGGEEFSSEQESEIPRLTPEYDEKERIPTVFIDPQPAEGPNTSELVAGDFKMQVSLNLDKEGRFRVSGIKEKSKQGGIVSGRLWNNMVKINHIELDKSLRGHDPKIGVALLSKAEEQLKNIEVKIIYAKFSKIVTIDAFIKNGYEIILPESISDEIRKNLLINTEDDVDKRIRSKEDYEMLKSKNEDTKQILLKKEI